MKTDTWKQRHQRLWDWADKFLPSGVPLLTDWSNPGPKGRLANSARPIAKEFLR